MRQMNSSGNKKVQEVWNWELPGIADGFLGCHTSWMLFPGGLLGHMSFDPTLWTNSLATALLLCCKSFFMQVPVNKMWFPHHKCHPDTTRRSLAALDTSCSAQPTVAGVRALTQDSAPSVSWADLSISHLGSCTVSPGGVILPVKKTLFLLKTCTQTLGAWFWGEDVHVGCETIWDHLKL